MKRFGKKRERGEYNFWQPATDMMTGLVFILLLLVALLGLFLVYTPEQEAETAAETQETGRDDEEGDSYGEYETEPETEAETWEDHDDGGGDDDGGGGDGIGPGWGEEEGIKSAVLVELVDEETQRIVRTEGVRFELYEANGALQILNTYYPEKISYREFATTEEGIFYLPEKIYQAHIIFGN